MLTAKTNQYLDYLSFTDFACSRFTTFWSTCTMYQMWSVINFEPTTIPEARLKGIVVTE